jgi:hypothetical protein
MTDHPFEIIMFNEIIRAHPWLTGRFRMSLAGGSTHPFPVTLQCTNDGNRSSGVVADSTSNNRVALVSDDIGAKTCGASRRCVAGDISGIRQDMSAMNLRANGHAEMRSVLPGTVTTRAHDHR